jgi:hypothetical protein
LHPVQVTVQNDSDSVVTDIVLKSARNHRVVGEIGALAPGESKEFFFNPEGETTLLVTIGGPSAIRDAEMDLYLDHNLSSTVIVTVESSPDGKAVVVSAEEVFE